MAKKQGTAQALKAERLKLGITRREMDRARQQAQDPAKARPRFWWVQK